ncbi:MAG: SEL1-like repeat protein [Pseudolabrys sp.]|nr:SEL1-like repeat protein [Pseudolabrys sp.]
MRLGRLKSLRPETREAVKAAARRSGQSVQEWLDTVAAQQAAQLEDDDDLFDDDSESVEQRLDELTRKIDRLTGTGPAAYAPLRQRAPAPAPAPAPAVPTASDTDHLAKLVERLDRRLDHFVSFAHSLPSVVTTPTAPGGVDRAVQEITARQRALRGEAVATPQRAAPPAPQGHLPPFPANFTPAPPAAPQPIPTQPLPAQAMAAHVDPQYAHAAGYAAPQAHPTHAHMPAAPMPTAHTLPHPAPFQPAPAPMAAPAMAPPMPQQAPLPTQDLSGLEKQLRSITNQIETLRRPGVEDAINALRDELAQIAQALTDAMPRHVIDAVEAQIQNLTQRLSEGRQAGVGEQVLNNIEQHLAQVHEALRSLTPAEHLIGFNETVSALAERIDQIVTQRDPASFRQFEDAVNNLRAMTAHVASNETVGQLAAQVQTLAAKVDQIAYTSSGDAALAHLEQRISALADAIATRNQNGSAVPQRLEHLVGSLTEKIEQFQSTRGHSTAADHLEERIIKLAEKLDASDSRLANLESVERGLTELLAQADRSNRGREPAGEPPAHVDALRRDVARTQDSLEVMQGTLGILVDRLAAIEHGIRERPAAPPVAALPQAAPITLQQPVEAVAAQMFAAVAQATHQAKAAAAGEMPSPPLAPAMPEQRMPTVEAPPVMPAQPPAPVQAAPVQAQPARPQVKQGMRRSQPIDPDLPPDHPIEPGMARPAAARNAGPVVASPAARIAASEAALSVAQPAAMSAPGGTQTDFITAARRAAKTAGQMNSGPMVAEPIAPAPVTAPRIEPRTDLLIDPEPVDEPRHAFGTAGRGSMLGVLRGKLKSLLIASSVVAIVVGGYYIVGSMLDGQPNTKPASVGSKAANPPPPGLYEDMEPDAEGDATASRSGAPATAPVAPATPLGAGSGFKLLAPNSTMQTSPDQTPAPEEKPETPDVTGSIGNARAVYADKLPPAIGGPRLRDAAARGEAAAAYEVGNRFAEGQGVARSTEDAARWFERAARRGLAPAQFRLGSLYEKGQGVRRDLKEARRYYTLAADQGHAKAMHNLAVLYAEGIDGKPDYKTAAEWFEKAAGFGVSDSQYNLGILYARGLGTTKDMIASYKWFSLAAAQGDKESAKKRDDVATRLDAAGRAKAETAVRSWAPHLQPQDAIRVAVPAGGWDQGAEATKDAAQEPAKESAKEPRKPIRDVTKEPVKQSIRAPLQLSAR